MEKLNLIEMASQEILLKDEINGYNLSMIYIALAEDVAYFNGTGETLIYMFVKELPKELFKRMNSLEFTITAMQIVASFTVNHRVMVKALLIENDYKYEEKDYDTMIVKFSEKSIITIKFKNDILEKIYVIQDGRNNYFG